MQTESERIDALSSTVGKLHTSLHKLLLQKKITPVLVDDSLSALTGLVDVFTFENGKPYVTTYHTSGIEGHVRNLTFMAQLDTLNETQRFTDVILCRKTNENSLPIIKVKYEHQSVGSMLEKMDFMKPSVGGILRFAVHWFTFVDEARALRMRPNSITCEDVKVGFDDQPVYGNFHDATTFSAGESEATTTYRALGFAQAQASGAGRSQILDNLLSTTTIPGRTSAQLVDIKCIETIKMTKIGYDNMWAGAQVLNAARLLTPDVMERLPVICNNGGSFFADLFTKENRKEAAEMYGQQSDLMLDALLHGMDGNFGNVGDEFIKEIVCEIAASVTYDAVHSLRFVLAQTKKRIENVPGIDPRFAQAVPVLVKVRAWMRTLLNDKTRFMADKTVFHMLIESELSYFFGGWLNKEEKLILKDTEALMKTLTSTGGIAIVFRAVCNEAFGELDLHEILRRQGLTRALPFLVKILFGKIDELGKIGVAMAYVIKVIADGSFKKSLPAAISVEQTTLVMNLMNEFAANYKG